MPGADTQIKSEDVLTRPFTEHCLESLYQDVQRGWHPLAIAKMTHRKVEDIRAVMSALDIHYPMPPEERLNYGIRSSRYGAPYGMDKDPEKLRQWGLENLSQKLCGRVYIRHFDNWEEPKREGENLHESISDRHHNPS